MKITVISDNTVHMKGLRSEWGFACLVEAWGKTILFDTGASADVLLHNMRKLNIRPESVDFVFISHVHHDHTGGLPGFLVAHSVTVFAPDSATTHIGEGTATGIREAFRLHDGIHSTGELGGLEQSLVVEVGGGVAVIAGCAHPGVEAILRKVAAEFGRPKALIGGLHDFNNFSILEGLELVCPAHCTRHRTPLLLAFPGKCISGGAGKVIEMQDAGVE
jgi:7,8-dihydropterin-6-yl-methyl-4-(beta-D-ribofuranosyl)aminobenzene 5'-phosphate synthase